MKAAGQRCVCVVGGSHSVHVRVPAQMLRAAGYRVVLADLEVAQAPGATDVFNAVYTLPQRWERWAARRPRGAAPAEAAHEREPVAIETPTRVPSLVFQLTRAWFRAGRLLQVVRRERPGVLHFQSLTAGGMTAYYLLQRLGWAPPGKRPGLLAHLWGYHPRYPAIRRREIQVVAHLDQIHTSSPAVARMYREHYAAAPEKLHVFVRGIELATFAPRDAATLAAARAAWGVPADKFVIIHNRHLHPMYRVDIAVDAFIALAREGHPVFLMLVRGSMRDEQYEQSLLQRLDAAGLRDRVTLLPHVLSAPEMATALQLAHCSVNCVPFDAFPVSILEAMYCGAVPVVRNLESYTQFVRDGETAFAVEGEPNAYVPRIRQLITQPDLRRRLAAAGAALVSAEGSAEIFRKHTLALIVACWQEPSA